MDNDIKANESKETAEKSSKRGKHTNGSVSAKGQISHNRITCISSCCGSKQVHNPKHSSDLDSDEETKVIEAVKVKKDE